MGDSMRVAEVLRAIAYDVEHGKYGRLETQGEADAFGIDLAEALGNYVEAI